VSRRSPSAGILVAAFGGAEMILLPIHGLAVGCARRNEGAANRIALQFTANGYGGWSSGRGWRGRSLRSHHLAHRSYDQTDDHADKGDQKENDDEIENRAEHFSRTLARTVTKQENGAPRYPESALGRELLLLLRRCGRFLCAWRGVRGFNF
jgi:hypothetical protein